MKDINDEVTHDAFQVYLEDLERESLVADCLVTGGHYQAVTAPSFLACTGRRWNGSRTPDSIKNMWSTPRDVVAWLEDRYGKYQLDAAADYSNRVCDKFYDEKINCLTRWWGSNKHVWLNPPYDNPLPFVEKAIEQMEHGNQIDILLPGDNSTAWFSLAQKYASEVIWMVGQIVEIEGKAMASRSGRLAFLKGDTNEPVAGNNKGSVLFVMRKLKEGESQQTHYVPVNEICKSVENKRMVKIK